MNVKHLTTPRTILYLFVLLAMLAFALPQPVSAATFQSIRILSVKSDDSVTLSGKDFPAGRIWTVRMDKAGNKGIDGIVAGEVKLDKGGSFETTVKIPAELRGVKNITLRLESNTGGWWVYNSFVNRTYTVTAQPTQPAQTAQPTQPAQTTNRSCQIVSVTPSREVVRADFDIVWTIKNTSGKDWDASSIDYKYISGQKMYKHAAVYDLPATVKAGETVKIVVDMRGPEQAGTYTTNWALVSGSTTLCSLPATVAIR
jgi:hypothetical protein